MRLCRLACVGLLWMVAGTPASALDPKYLPGDTEVVVTLNLKQMLASEVAKTYKDAIDQAKAFIDAQLQGNPAAKYLEQAGFDVFRDLHGITVASNGGKDLDAGVVILHGHFDANKIAATAQEIARENPELVKVTKIDGRTVFEVTPPGEKRMFAAVLNDKTLVATAAETLLKETMARDGGRKGKELKASFRDLLKTTSEKQSFSFVATGPALSKLIEQAPVPNADAAAGMLLQLEGISAAITLAKDIQFQIGINAKDAETAKQTVAAGNFGLLTIRTLAAQKAKEDEKLQPLVDIAKTLRITADGNNVLLRGEVSTENLEKLIKNLPKNLNQ